MKKEILFTIFLITAIISSVNAAKVGIVVEFPDGEISTRCLEVSEGINGYDVLNSAGLSIAWSPPSAWGHALCAINDVGCPSDNCFCSSDYWGFYIREYGDRSWKYSPVGFDGGTSCEEHYCVSHGDLLGFAYGAYGTKPTKKSFEDVCPTQERREKRKFSVSIQPKEPKKGGVVKINITDNGTSKPIRNAEVELFRGTPGISRKVFSGRTNSSGIIEFKIQEIGTYTVRINVRKYNPPQFYYDIAVITEAITTTTSITTSTTSTTTTTITSITPIPSTTSPTTTSATTTTTTPEEPTTTTTTTAPTTITVQEQSHIIGRAINFSSGGKSRGNLLITLLLLLLLLWFFAFKNFQK